MVDSRLSDRVTVSVPQEFGEMPSLTFATRITLDSTVQRTQDTLGFFTVSGYMTQTSDGSARALEDEGLSVSSEMTGQLVWSSGWSGFVSGANRVTMEISRGRPSGAPTIERLEPELSIQATTRFQVRP